MASTYLQALQRWSLTVDVVMGRPCVQGAEWLSPARVVRRQWYSAI